MTDSLTRLSSDAVGYAVLIVLLVAMTVMALVRLIAVFRMLKQYYTPGEHAGFKHEELQT
jgi:hypothetical protein